jgi:hypothetical protein
MAHTSVGWSPCHGIAKKPVKSAGGTKNISKKPTFFVSAKKERYNKNAEIAAYTN